MYEWSGLSFEGWRNGVFGFGLEAYIRIREGME